MANLYQSWNCAHNNVSNLDIVGLAAKKNSLEWEYDLFSRLDVLDILSSLLIWVLCFFEFRFFYFFQHTLATLWKRSQESKQGGFDLFVQGLVTGILDCGFSIGYHSLFKVLDQTITSRHRP